MPENLLVGVLGNSNSGKSYTWNTLFGRDVRTGRYMRPLYLTEVEEEYVEVFLVSGSPEEREAYVGEIITVENPRIVLCSMQYNNVVIETLDWFVDNDYFLFIHWLNPGYSDDTSVPAHDHQGLMDRILAEESLLGFRNGQIPPTDRVQEMRDFVYGWASSRDLLLTDS